MLTAKRTLTAADNLGHYKVLLNKRNIHMRTLIESPYLEVLYIDLEENLIALMAHIKVLYPEWTYRRMSTSLRPV